MLKTIGWCFIGLCMALGNAHAAPILLVDGAGKLTGANGVDVGGTLYDVRFVDGTCVAVFSGCDSPADFTFTSQADAQAASTALLNQVFLDGSAGNFDTQPHLTNGCDDLGACRPVIPFALGTNIVNATFTSNEAGVNDLPDPFNFSALSDDSTESISDATWAVWTPHVADAPLPGTLALLGLGLAGLAWSRRRRQ